MITYIHTYTRNLANVALSIRVTLNTKPSQVMIISMVVPIVIVAELEKLFILSNIGVSCI